MPSAMLASVPWAERSGRRARGRERPMAGMQGASGGGDDAARSREAQQRPKPQRPRDELGRLLPAGSANRLVLPDFDVLSLEQNHALAIELFDAGNYFGAHEAWETCWQQARGADDEEFFKGLSQLGAGANTPQNCILGEHFSHHIMLHDCFGRPGNAFENSVSGLALAGLAGWRGSWRPARRPDPPRCHPDDPSGSTQTPHSGGGFRHHVVSSRCLIHYRAKINQLFSNAPTARRWRARGTHWRAHGAPMARLWRPIARP